MRGPFSTPITPLPGSLFHADPHATADNPAPKSIVQRIAALEAKIEKQDATIEAAQKALAIETSKPSNDDEVEAIEALRADLTSEDDELRTFARGRVNMSLRRLIKRIAITNTGGFRIQPDDQSWWLFDEKGVMLEGEYVP